MGIDIGLGDGLSADELSRRLRSYLREPHKLFRRVRDKHVNLHLSKAAQAYHPGRGVYRSSYKNARRLAATETNIAYRTSGYERYQKLDFVVGIRIELSNNHTLNGRAFSDICDELSAPLGSNATKGRGCYPKDFKFTGWHPLCRCTTFTILKTDEEVAADTAKILAGEPLDGASANRVADVPDEFKQWVQDNQGRIEQTKSLPYFLRDNKYERLLTYARYAENPNYRDVDFYWTSGGVKATHNGHSHDMHKGWYETTIQNVGYRDGHSVILEAEDHTRMNVRNTEGLWDGKKFEIAGAESGTPNNIRNALKHCASKPGCEVAVMFMPNEYENHDIREAIRKYEGLRGTSQRRKFDLVCFISSKGIIYDYRPE